MQKLKELSLYDKTLIYVTADHGFDEGKTSHRDAPYVFLGTNDPDVKQRGERADIAPTILQKYGLNLRSFRPALDGISLLNSGKSRAVGSRSTANTIHLAARIGDLVKVKGFIDKGADVNSKNNAGQTPLHLACSQGKKDVAEFLISKRADVNSRNNNCGTPLHQAAMNGHKDLVELLIANGADVNSKNKQGRTPLFMARQAGYMKVAELLR